MPNVLNGITVRKNYSYCAPYQATIVADEHIQQQLSKELSAVPYPCKNFLNLSISF